MSGLLGLALMFALLGLVLVVLSLRGRKRRGLGSGETVALDNVTLFSERLKLVGRPDRIVRQRETVIPEEWKPTAKRVSPGHRLQIGAYLILVEEEFGVRPPFGVVIIAGGKRVQVENTEQLRSQVLDVAERIREHRAKLREEIPGMAMIRDKMGHWCLPPV
jgi:CRISPR-associated exonuclease Cas4